jgi:hypothetical protein
MKSLRAKDRGDEDDVTPTCWNDKDSERCGSLPPSTIHKFLKKKTVRARQGFTRVG